VKRVLLLLALLVWRTALIAQETGAAVTDCYVDRIAAMEMNIHDYYNMIVKSREDEISGKADSVFAVSMRLSEAEMEANRAYSDSVSKTRERTVWASGMSIDLEDNESARFMFKRDSSKLYLEASFNSAGFKMTRYFMRDYYEITFTDGAIFRHAKPFFTSFDHSDVYLLLEGGMEVLQFDEDGKPAGTKILNGDTVLLAKMLQVPIRQIAIYHVCDPRFRKLADDCDNDEFTPWIWALPGASANEVSGYLRCLYGSKK
jgi:hypothetical protein